MKRTDLLFILSRKVTTRFGHIQERSEFSIAIKPVLDTTQKDAVYALFVIDSYCSVHGIQLTSWVIDCY